VTTGNFEDGATLDALFEAGCGDATFGQVDRVDYADFVREASSLAEAVRSAIEQVESGAGPACGLGQTDDLVTMSGDGQPAGGAAVTAFVSSAR